MLLGLDLLSGQKIKVVSQAGKSGGSIGNWGLHNQDDAFTPTGEAEELIEMVYGRE